MTMANSNKNIKNCIQSEKNVKETKKKCAGFLSVVAIWICENTNWSDYQKNESPNTNENEIK